jgi:hypothetical protein
MRFFLPALIAAVSVSNCSAISNQVDTSVIRNPEDTHREPFFNDPMWERDRSKCRFMVSDSVLINATQFRTLISFRLSPVNNLVIELLRDLESRGDDYTFLGDDRWFYAADLALLYPMNQLYDMMVPDPAAARDFFIISMDSFRKARKNRDAIFDAAILAYLCEDFSHTIDQRSQLEDSDNIYKCSPITYKSTAYNPLVDRDFFEKYRKQIITNSILS